MIQKRHLVSIVVNGKEVELYDQESLNLRINNVLYDPTQIQSKTAEYSFSFNLPITKKNAKIFNYANNLSKLNKFDKLYNCKVYADGYEVFSGDLKLSSINNENFKCNLVNVKINKVEEIFGESKMNELKWYVPFLGISSINAINNDTTTDYYFPLVSYGVFQKKPLLEYSGISQYSPKHTLDKTLQLYIESFPPSMKLTETIKRLFQTKGYDVQGNIFEDEIATSIFMSEYLKDKQDPLYNYGSDLGKLKVDFTWKNIDRQGAGSYSVERPLEYTLTHPYEKAWSEYNFSVANIWDCWAAGNKYLTSINYDNDNLFRNNCIVVPADGLYKISMEVEMSIDDAPSKIETTQWGWNNGNVEEQNTDISKSWDNYPVEVQLVRNTNDCEMIYGYVSDNSVTPHEAPPVGYRRTSSGRYQQIETKYNMGYMPKHGEFLCYDPYVSENFICGLTSIGECASAMKNGYSWSSETSVKNNVRYNCNGYWGVNNSLGSYSWELTEYNKNTLPGAPTNYMSLTGVYKKKGKVTCIMQLNKNDIISLKCVEKYYPQREGLRGITYYDVKLTGSIQFEAFAPNAERVVASSTLNWNDESKFDVNLNLGNFLNAEEKQSDFVNNFIKAFNLSYKQEGNVVYLNKQSTDFNQPISPIDIDNRINSNEAETEPIDYPTYIQVKFSIDDEEAGFYDSVPSDKINLDDWKNYADIGSEKVILVENNDSKAEEISLNTSYTWYTTFQYIQYDNDGNEIGSKNIQLPIISKDEYMIEGYAYEDSMKVDGKGLKQRWWFRQPVDNSINLYLVNGDDILTTIPIGVKDDFLLNYNNDDNTLLTRYFNIISMGNSNYVNIECYLSPLEYKIIKNGGLIKFDDDIYIVSEISGYDPTGNNKTKLTLIKKA